MSIPNPIIVDMEVVANNVPAQMEVATQYDLPIDLQTLEADHNGNYSALSGVAWDSVHVAVPGPSGTVQINANGTVDVEQYASASVNVPNSYSAQDEGKVVQSGALVAQTDETVTTNGVVNTTTVKQLTVAVPVPSGLLSFLQGSFTPLANSSQITIDIGVNINPRAVYIGQKTLPTSEVASRGQFIEGNLMNYDYQKYTGEQELKNASYGLGFASWNAGAVGLQETNFSYSQSGTVLSVSVHSSYPFKSGVEYVWAAIY